MQKGNFAGTTEEVQVFSGKERNPERGGRGNRLPRNVKPLPAGTSNYRGGMGLT